MANLLIDIGNTAVKAAWAEELILTKIIRYQGDKVKNFILSLVEQQRADIIVISSVYVISNSDKEIFQKLCNYLIILDNTNKELYKEYNLPSYLSPDRFVSIIASKHFFRDNSFTLIDFGNTLSIDVIGEKAEYVGGNISLGCKTRFKALNKYSKSLPLVNLGDDIPILANDLESSISAGVVNGIILEIEGYMRLYPNNSIIFTGGDANYFAKRMKKSIFVICNLVLMGLALIAKNNVKEIN